MQTSGDPYNHPEHYPADWRLDDQVAYHLGNGDPDKAADVLAAEFPGQTFVSMSGYTLGRHDLNDVRANLAAVGLAIDLDSEDREGDESAWYVVPAFNVPDADGVRL